MTTGRGRRIDLPRQNQYTILSGASSRSTRRPTPTAFVASRFWPCV